MSHSKFNLEQSLLLEAIKRKYGYDFTHYTSPSIKRRIQRVKEIFNIETDAELISAVLLDETVAIELINQNSIVHTDFFREPKAFKDLKRFAVNDLKTYPFLKIWHAGCATGKEVYSMAIFLKENDLHKCTHLYATDYNQTAINQASTGVYDIESLDNFRENYRKAGGKKKVDRYISIKGNTFSINHELKKNITFATHNLVSDWVFGEMNLIMCRNVMIYFDMDLKNRVLNLFYQSLDNRGMLCIGKGEVIEDTSEQFHYSRIGDAESLYRKTSEALKQVV